MIRGEFFKVIRFTLDTPSTNDRAKVDLTDYGISSDIAVNLVPVLVNKAGSDGAQKTTVNTGEEFAINSSGELVLTEGSTAGFADGDVYTVLLLQPVNVDATIYASS